MTFKLHTRSIVFIIICCGGLLGIGIFGILPNSRAMNRLDLEITEMSEKIARQQTLTPVFHKLAKQVQEKEHQHLPLPEKIGISQVDVDGISMILKRLSDENNLKLEGIASNVDVFSGEARNIEIDLILSGDFFNFRQMLLDLEALPYLENIDAFNVNTLQNGKRFNLKLVLAQK